MSDHPRDLYASSTRPGKRTMLALVVDSWLRRRMGVQYLVHSLVTESCPPYTQSSVLCCGPWNPRYFSVTTRWLLNQTVSSWLGLLRKKKNGQVLWLSLMSFLILVLSLCFAPFLMFHAYKTSEPTALWRCEVSRLLFFPCTLWGPNLDSARHHLVGIIVINVWSFRCQKKKKYKISWISLQFHWNIFGKTKKSLCQISYCQLFLKLSLINLAGIWRSFIDMETTNMMTLLNMFFLIRSSKHI